MNKRKRISLKAGPEMNQFGEMQLIKRSPALLGALLFWFVLPATRGQAQEAARMSLASAEAAQARRKAASTIGYYNLQVGPTAWRFGAGLGLEYNDNVTLRQGNAESDFIFSPQMKA